MEAARRDYGVVIHQQGRRFELNVEATATLRQGSKQETGQNSNLAAKNAKGTKNKLTTKCFMSLRSSTEDENGMHM